MNFNTNYLYVPLTSRLSEEIADNNNFDSDVVTVKYPSLFGSPFTHNCSVRFPSKSSSITSPSLVVPKTLLFEVFSMIWIKLVLFPKFHWSFDFQIFPLFVNLVPFTFHSWPKNQRRYGLKNKVLNFWFDEILSGFLKDTHHEQFKMKWKYKLDFFYRRYSLLSSRTAPALCRRLCQSPISMLLWHRVSWQTITHNSVTVCFLYSVKFLSLRLQAGLNAD